MDPVHREPSAADRDLLIIHPGALGDVVVMFALIDELNKNRRGITLACQASIGKLAQSLKLVDRQAALESAGWVSIYGGRPRRDILRLLEAHRRIVLFAVGAELESIINAHAATACVRVPPRPPVQMREHVTEYAAERLVAAGLMDRIPPLTRAVCRPSSRKSRRSAADRHPPVLLHPGAGSQRKRWPLASFLAVAEEVRSAGGNPEIIVGPAERDLLQTPLPPDLRVHVPGDLPDLLYLLTSAAAFIGNDSGVAHLAACLGLPTTVVFTSSDPLRWRPNGPAVKALAPALPCTPCFETRESNCPRPECLHAVTPEAVVHSHARLCEEHRKR